MTSNNSSRSIVEGALFAALTAVIALAGFFIPPLLVVVGVLIPLPLTLMVYRQGLKKGFLSLVTAYILLLILFTEPLSVTALIMQSAPLGLLLGLLFKNKISAGKSIAACTAASAVLTFTVLIFIGLLTGISLSDIENQAQMAVEQSLQFYHNAGLLKNVDADEMQKSMKQTLHLMTILLPGILIIGAVFSSVITYLLSRAVLKRLKYSVVPLPAFSRWTFPWYTLWALVIGLALTIAGDRYQLQTMATAGKNILYVSGMLFMVLGISVATYYYKKLPLHPAIKLMLLFFAVIWPFTPAVLLGIGVIDPLLDMRRINRQQDTVKRR
ncbi:uncharacterized protein YybS (DUF2232 family) [Desulfohalotomaculum tongense]|uniref:YybS family protein n=1 Tax=Desulforadius tongensis TaxID=1216062 RepID=UPI00195E8C7A|nr:YybS family protein [Desulforadius tongensis]MBM7856101.1 uncharacterized protein YybS (DUF2232 family) [Desulforadius tongensis]